MDYPSTATTYTMSFESSRFYHQCLMPITISYDTHKQCIISPKQGAAINVRGPALLDLQRSTGSSIGQITTAVFVTIALGWAGGSLVGGVLYDRYQKQLVIGISLLLSSVFTGILPWCTNIIALAFIVLISGGFLSSTITGMVFRVF